MTASGAITMESSISSAISSVNANMSNLALQIIDYATADETEDRIDNIKNKLTADIFARLNFDIYNENNLEQYVDELCEIKGITSTDLLALITNINEIEKNLARRKIADSAGDETLISELNELTDEFAFFTEKMTEKEFNESVSKLDMITRIRVDDTVLN